MKTTFLICAVILLFACPSKAQNRAQDSLDIIKTSLDYIDGFYTADGDRMQSALHPELAKRIITKNANGWDDLGQMSALSLIEGTRHHKPTPVEKRQHDVFVTDIFRDAATA